MYLANQADGKNPKLAPNCSLNPSRRFTVCRLFLYQHPASAQWRWRLSYRPCRTDGVPQGHARITMAQPVTDFDNVDAGRDLRRHACCRLDSDQPRHSRARHQQRAGSRGTSWARSSGWRSLLVWPRRVGRSLAWSYRRCLVRAKPPLRPREETLGRQPRIVSPCACGAHSGRCNGRCCTAAADITRGGRLGAWRRSHQSTARLAAGRLFTTVYVQAVALTGRWQPGFLPVVGLNRPSSDTGWAFTWEHKASKLQFNGAAGVSFKTSKNTETNYQTGNEFHFEWAIGREVATGLMLGIVGYDYRQLTGDSGSGATLGPLKGSVDAIGADLSYTTVVHKHPLILNLRHYQEFKAENRWQGNSTPASATLKW